MEVKLTNSAKKFLVFSYFGITEDELEENNESVRKSIAMKCADKAYEDMCRTLTFSEKMDGRTKEEKKNIEKKRKDFRRDICKLIVDNMLGEHSENIIGLFRCDKNDFCSNHEELCKKIRNAANEYPPKGNQKLLKKRNENDSMAFHYGQAQKWLNMTIKYMRMFDCFSKLMNDNDFENELHVPVDAYIITKAKKEFDINITNKPWSRWEIGDYTKFQKDLRKKLSDESPIKWEEKAWIEIAKKEHDPENKK